MAVQETNLRAVLTLIDEMSPVLKSVQKKLRAASRDIRNGFEGIKDMALTAGAGITALAGAGTGVWFATTAAAETATQMDMMSRQTGVATERLQAWQAVAVQSGMEGEEFAEALRDMNIELSDAATGGKDELAQLLEKVGISARDASGNIKTADQVFLDFADAVARQTDSAVQLRMAISAFGEDTGAKLLPMLQKGSAAFRESEEAMKAAGSAISQNQIDSLKSFRAEWESVKMTFSSASTSMLSALAPSLSAVAEGLGTVLDRIRPLLQEKAEEWANNLATGISKIPLDVIADKIGALIQGGEALKEEFGVVGQALSLAMAHLAESAGSYFAGKGAKAAYDLYGAFTTLGRGVSTLIKAAGPLVGAASPFVLWGAMIAGLATAVVMNWDDIVATTETFVKGIKKALEPVLDFFADMIEGIKGIFSGISEAVSGALDSIVPDFLKEKRPEVELLKQVQVEGDGAAAQTVDASFLKPDEPEEEDPDSGIRVERRSFGFGAPIPKREDRDRAVSGSLAYDPNFSARDVRMVSQAPAAPTQRVQARVGVSFSNAPQGMSVDSIRGDRDAQVDTSIDYARVGRGPYAYDLDSF